jgi:hypothetical protein
MRALEILFICLYAAVSYAAEPAKITRAQAEIFQKRADETRGLRTDAPRWFACTPAGALPTAPDLMSKARDIVVRAQADFSRTKPTTLQSSSSSGFFNGLLTRNQELRLSLADVTPRNCDDVRSRSLTTIYDQERGFAFVASQASLTFDLKVTSDPAGATVTYWRAGDTHHQVLNSVTDTMIENLDWAIWFIRLEVPHYAPAERAFDPYRERITALYVHLTQ